MSKFSLNLLGLFLVCSCSNPESAETKVKEASVVTAPGAIIKEVLEAAPESYLNTIRDRADGVEATMYNSGASFSVFDRNSAFTFFQQILFKAPALDTKNQIGHIMFLEKGENILLVGVYDNGSDIFIKIDEKDNNKTYFNIITGKARDLFTNVQVQKVP
jgi:hypothetical protein